MVEGALFEALIYDLISIELVTANLGQEVSVRYEDLNPQRGRDIVVESSCPFTLFGIPFVPSKNKRLLIYVECKSTGRQAGLSLESFAANASQNMISECDAYILVTNAYLTCNALFDFWRILSEKKKGAWVVEGGRLTNICRSIGINMDYPVQPTNPKRFEINGVFCEQRLERLTDSYPQKGELTVTLLNSTAEHCTGRLLFQSTESWKVDEENGGLQLSFDLKPYELFAHRFYLVREVPDRDEKLSMALEVGAELIQLHNQVKKLGRIIFKAPFLGKDHHRARNNFSTVFQNIDVKSPPGEGSLHLFSIIGPTGTGKSRLTDELEWHLGEKAHAFRFVRHYLGSRNENSLANTIKAFHRKGITLPGQEIMQGGTQALIESVVNLKGVPMRIPVLVLEDLHLADEHTCQTLTRLLRNTKTEEGNAVIIMVGRSDFSHNNAAFTTFLSFLSIKVQENHTLHVSLAELDGEAFESLVREMLPSAPPAVIKTIESLSGRIPQQVIQCIEWLLDMSSVRVRYRLASGVVNSLLFNQRAESLPGSMTEILANRFTILITEAGGEKAQLVLAAAALLGPEISSSVFDLAGADHLRAVLRLLQERRFLVQESNGSIRWQHESLLFHYRNWLLDEGEQIEGKGTPLGYKSWRTWREAGHHYAVDAARALMAKPEILNHLTLLDQGLIAAVSGAHAQALNHWDGMLAEVSAIDNWSTANLKGEIFPYLQWAFKSHFVTYGWSSVLPRLVRTMTYIGGYFWSLADGIRAAQNGFAEMRRASPKNKRELAIEELGIKVMVAHFRLDAGHARYCLGEFSDLLARYEESKIQNLNLDIGFEIFNCLGMLFGYLNHRSLAEYYFSMAESEGRRLGNKTLLAKLPGDRSLLYQFSDHAKWVALCRQSTLANKSNGTKRHLQHAELGDLLVMLTNLVHTPDLTDWGKRVDNILEHIKTIEDSCRADAYFSVVPRIQLLKAATLYVRATGCLWNTSTDYSLLTQADREADIGVGVAQRRGIGFAPWALLNLRAMIAWREGRRDHAARHLETATEILHGDGLLFLGKADLSTPNQIVLANYIKILKAMEVDGRVNDLLKRISSYMYPDLYGEGRNYMAMESSSKYHALLATEELGASLMLDHGTMPPLALVVWF